MTSAASHGEWEFLYIILATVEPVCLEHHVLLSLFCSWTVSGQSTQRRLLFGKHLFGKQDTAFSLLGASVLEKISCPDSYTCLPLFSLSSISSSPARQRPVWEWNRKMIEGIVWLSICLLSSLLLDGISFGLWYINYFQLLCQWFSHILVSRALTFYKIIDDSKIYKGYIYQHLLY